MSKKIIKNMKQEIFNGKFKKYTSQDGFSLVETLVAITILLLAVTGPLVVAYRSIQDASIAKDQATAIFLAQDAMEYVKNVRDSNLLNSDLWVKEMSVCSSSCAIDTLSAPANAFRVCSGACAPLRFDQSSGLYGYNSSWPQTIFTRTFNFSSLNSNEAVISVTVSWQNRKLSKSFTLKENIFNWPDL